MHEIAMIFQRANLWHPDMLGSYQHQTAWCIPSCHPSWTKEKKEFFARSDLRLCWYQMLQRVKWIWGFHRNKRASGAWWIWWQSFLEQEVCWMNETSLTRCSRRLPGTSTWSQRPFNHKQRDVWRSTAPLIGDGWHAGLKDWGYFGVRRWDCHLGNHFLNMYFIFFVRTTSAFCYFKAGKYLSGQMACFVRSLLQQSTRKIAGTRDVCGGRGHHDAIDGWASQYGSRFVCGEYNIEIP